MVLMRAVGDATDTISTLFGPWAKIYSHSKGVSAAVLFFHLVPLMLAAGPALMMDLATVRVATRGGLNDRARQLKEQHGSHRFVLGGLVLSFISGALLFFSDVSNFLGSVFFWVKIVCVGLLLINGYFITSTERKLLRWGDKDTVWHRMQLHAHASIVLWVATILAGVLLASFA